MVKFRSGDGNQQSFNTGLIELLYRRGGKDSRNPLKIKHHDYISISISHSLNILSSNMHYSHVPNKRRATINFYDSKYAIDVK